MGKTYLKNLFARNSIKIAEWSFDLWEGGVGRPSDIPATVFHSTRSHRRHRQRPTPSIVGFPFSVLPHDFSSASNFVVNGTHQVKTGTTQAPHWFPSVMIVSSQFVEGKNNYVLLQFSQPNEISENKHIDPRTEFQKIVFLLVI